MTMQMILIPRNTFEVCLMEWIVQFYTDFLIQFNISNCLYMCGFFFLLVSCN